MKKDNIKIKGNIINNDNKNDGNKINSIEIKWNIINIKKEDENGTDISQR